MGHCSSLIKRCLFKSLLFVVYRVGPCPCFLFSLLSSLLALLPCLFVSSSLRIGSLSLQVVVSASIRLLVSSSLRLFVSSSLRLPFLSFLHLLPLLCLLAPPSHGSLSSIFSFSLSLSARIYISLSSISLLSLVHIICIPSLLCLLSFSLSSLLSLFPHVTFALLSLSNIPSPSPLSLS